MIDVSNKWALITGASRGIGKEIAIYMAKKGCNLILHSREISHLDATHKEVTKLGITAHLIQCELSDANQIETMLETVDSLDLKIDFVFNNAGLQIAYRTDYYNTPIQDYEISFAVNTTAPMKICYHFLPKMIANNFGRIINTTSGIDQEPEQAGYSASKAALDKVTFDIASKLDNKNVIISLFDPGWCKTDLGGQSAPNEVSSTIPGAVLGAFLETDPKNNIIRGQAYSGLELASALALFNKEAGN